MLSCKSHGRAGEGGIVAQDVAKDFVQHFGLYRLLYKMFGALLQRGQNVFLIADRVNHDNCGVGILAHDAFDRFNAFHLRHGDVHEHDVRLGAVEFGDGGEAVTGFARDFAAEELHHFDDVLPGEDRIVHHQISDGLAVFPEQSSELWHNHSPYLFVVCSTNPEPRLNSSSLATNSKSLILNYDLLLEAGILSFLSFLSCLSDLSSRSCFSGRSNFSWRWRSA